MSGKKMTAARLHARLQAHQLREGLNEGFLYLFTFSKVSNTGILITIFT
jgi:hypothetical protein